MTHTQSMEQRFADVGRRIDSLLQKTRDVDWENGPVGDELDVWRRWRDEVQVQAKLASMDARDAFGPTLERLERTVGRAQEVLDDVLDGADFDADELQSEIARELAGLRRELEEAGARFAIA